MKLLLGLMLLTFLSTAIASEDERCRFDLIGPNSMPDSILESRPMSRKECQERAIYLLKQNAESYDKVLIWNGIKKPTVIELKDLK